MVRRAPRCSATRCCSRRSPASPGRARGRRDRRRRGRSRSCRSRAARARDAGGRPRAARGCSPAACVTNVVIGRMPFTLGVACASARGVRVRGAGGACAPPRAGRRAARWPASAVGPDALLMGSSLAAGTSAARDAPRSRRARAGWAWRRRAGFAPLGQPGPACSCAPPRSAGAGRRRARALRARCCRPACLAGLAIAVAFPEGGTGPLRRDRVLADARALRWRPLMLARRPRDGSAWPRCSTWRVLVGAFVHPDAVRAERAAARRAARPVAARAPPTARAPRVRWSSSAIGLLVYLQWLPAVRAVAEAHGDPATSEAFYAPRRALPRAARASPASASRSPLTRNHWEAADLAQRRSRSPAAGTASSTEKANPLFYGGQPLTRATLPRLAARRGGALGRAPERAARLLGPARGAVLRERACRASSSSSARRDWTIWEVARLAARSTGRRD